MKRIGVIAVFALILVFAIGAIGLAGVQNQNTQERMEVRTETARSQLHDGECPNEQLQIRREINEFRNLRREEGTNGEFEQRNERNRRQRFGG